MGTQGQQAVERVTHIHDVLIVGGGPAGLHAACYLAQHGCDVVVIEEHHAAGDPVHCTGVFASEAFDEFDIPRDAILNPLSRVTFHGPGGGTVVYTTPDVEAVVIDRRAFDHQLSVRASGCGVKVVGGSRVSEVAVDSKSVTAACRPTGVIRARAAILACGANYVLQRRLGLGLPSVFLQSAQVECASASGESVEVHFGRAVAKEGFAWVVPVQRAGSSFARVGLMCEGNARQQFRVFTQRVADRWQLAGGPGETLPEPRLKMLPLAPVARTYADRIVAIGDAAGLVKATTGGGIYYSLVSAALAAQVLVDRLATDTLGERDLAEYERLWRRRLGPELDAQLALRLMASRLNDGELDELFALARTDGIMPIVRRTAKFNQHRDLILGLLKHPPARRVFFRRLASSCRAAAL
jgi:geranylgeranyl reductase family protein